MKRRGSDIAFEDQFITACQNGDFWDQRRGDGGWNRENAERFVNREWAPSGIVSFAPREGVKFLRPRDQ